MEIPGLLDSGWSPKSEDVVKIFFSTAKTCQQFKGVYFNQLPVNSVEELETQFRSFDATLDILIKNPQNLLQEKSNCDISLLTYSHIEDIVKIQSFNEINSPEKENQLTLIEEHLNYIKQFLKTGAEGFVQIVAAKEWRIRMDNLVDIFCWWLWGTTDREKRTFNDE